MSPAGVRTPPVGLLAAVLLAALALRLAHLWEAWNGPFSPRFYLPIDGREYHLSALAWLRGSWPPAEAFFRPPLYTLFVGSVYAVFGAQPVAVLWVQAVLGTATCALAFGIAAELFAGRATPLLAAALCAACGTLVYFDAQLLSASLDAFLLALTLYLLLLAARRGALGLWWGAGAALGLSILNRGSGLLLVPLVLTWIALGARSRAPAPGGGRVLARSLGVVAPVLLLLAPVTLHNARWDEGGDRPLPPREVLRHLASGRFVLLAANSGINLYLGNVASLREQNRIDHPEHLSVYDRIRMEPSRRGITSYSAANAYLVRETWNHVLRSPGEWLGLMATKAAELVAGVEIPRNTNLYADRRHSAVLAALLWKRGIAYPSGVLIPLGLVGIGLALRDASRKAAPGGARGEAKPAEVPRGRLLAPRQLASHALVLAALALQGAFVVAFFVAERYRLPMLPLFAVYAAFALVEMARRAREGGARAAAVPAAASALLLVALNAGSGTPPPDHGYSEYHNLGVAHLERGDLVGAEAAFDRALGRNPAFVDSLIALCRVRLELSRAAEAEAPCRRAVELQPDSAAAQQQLGLALEALGRPSEAILHLRRALALEPGAPTATRALRRLEPAGTP